MSSGALVLTSSTTDADDVHFVEVDGRENVAGEMGVAKCKPPFWSMGAGGIVNGMEDVLVVVGRGGMLSAVYRPSFEMLGAGGVINGLVLVLMPAVLLLGISLGAMRSPLLDFQFKPSFWRTGGGGIVQEVSFSGIADAAEG